jgi:hypothetical protein
MALRSWSRPPPPQSTQLWLVHSRHVMVIHCFPEGRFPLLFNHLVGCCSPTRVFLVCPCPCHYNPRRQQGKPTDRGGFAGSSSSVPPPRRGSPRFLPLANAPPLGHRAARSKFKKQTRTRKAPRMGYCAKGMGLPGFLWLGGPVQQSEQDVYSSIHRGGLPTGRGGGGGGGVRLLPLFLYILPRMK